MNAQAAKRDLPTLKCANLMSVGGTKRSPGAMGHQERLVGSDEAKQLAGSRIGEGKQKLLVAPGGRF